MKENNFFNKAFEGIKELLGFYFVKLLILCFGSFQKNINPDDKSLASLPKLGKHIFTTYETLCWILSSDRQPTLVQASEAIMGIDLLTKGHGIFLHSFLTIPLVTVTKVASAKPILQSKANVQKSMIYRFIKPWLRTGLLISEKSIWRARRKCLVPTMHPKIIESYFPIFNEHAQIFCAKLGDRLDQRVDVIHLLSFMTLDVILETVMGVKMEIQKTEDSVYLDSINTNLKNKSIPWILNSFVSKVFYKRSEQCSVWLTSCSAERLVKLWYWPFCLFKLFPLGKKYINALNYTRNFTKNVIEKRKTRLLASKLEASKIEISDVAHDTKKRLSFLDLVLELHLNDQKFGLDDVQDEVETFLFGGHDTSSQNMGWTLYLLGLYPEALAKVHEELDAILGTDLNVPVTLEDVKNLVYLECAIKEAARLYPPVPLISRRLDEDTIIVFPRLSDGVIIPKGTVCNVLISQVHRDPDFYPDPEKYLPERFLPSEEKPLDPYAFLTFSAGPRGCVGSMFALLQMKVVLSTILRRYNVTSLLPRDKIVVTFQMVQTPVDDLPVKFTRRPSLMTKN